MQAQHFGNLLKSPVFVVLIVFFLSGCEVLLSSCEAGQVVVVWPSGDDFTVKAVGRSLCRQGTRVDIEPREVIPCDTLVTHLVGDLAIVAVHTCQVDDAVLILIDVADVAGVAQQLAAIVEQVIHLHEECIHARECAHNADAVHEHQDGVKLAVKGEHILFQHFFNTALAHCGHSQWRDVDGCDVLAHRLQGQGVATRSCSHIKDPAVSPSQCFLLDGRHLAERAEQRLDRYLIIDKRRRQHAQPSRLACGMEVGNRMPHGILFFNHL